MSEEILTIQQFKAWLEGVEEMQDDDWTPSDVQWKKIRSKISKLCEDIQKDPQASIATATSRNRPYTAPPLRFPENNPRMLDGVHVDHSNVIQNSSLVEEPIVRAPKQARVPPVDAVGIPVKTPNIDTSDGTYKSGFE